MEWCTEPTLPEYNFMPTNPLTLLNLCQAIRQTPQDALLSIDRETLMATRRALLALKTEVESALQRLSFVAEQQLK
jgi:hypothetical protein